jgi:hypothetical protein
METMRAGAEFRRLDLADGGADIVDDHPEQERDRGQHREAGKVIEGQGSQAGTERERPRDRHEQGQPPGSRVGTNAVEQGRGRERGAVAVAVSQPVKELDRF